MNTLNINGLQFLDSIYYKNALFRSDKTIFITGASGTGKSSLLKLLSYNTLPTRGEIFLNDKSIFDYEPFEYRRLVTLAMQEVFLFEGTIEENYMQYYEYREKSKPTVEQIQKLMSICALELPLNKDVSLMSGGEKQRLYISIILSFNPTFLLLDEPTAALDTQNSFKMLQNLIEYTQENAIGLIIVSHNASLVTKYAEEIVDLGGDGLVK